MSLIRESLQGCKLSARGAMLMKQDLFLILDEYADGEGAYLSSTLNQSEDWSVHKISLGDTVSSIGGFKTAVDYIIGSEPGNFNLLNGRREYME